MLADDLIAIKCNVASSMINIRFGEYLMITAYAVTSAFTTDGDCVTVSGTPTTLPTPFDVITDVEPSAGDPKTLQSIIMSGFVTWLHHTPTCSVSQMCFEPACLFNDEFYVSGDSHPASRNFLVPVIVLIVSAFTAVVCYLGQRHFRRITVVRKGRNILKDEPRPYLQAKTELDAEEEGKHELEAKNTEYELRSEERHEIEGDGGRAEMAESDREDRSLPARLERHELRGEEFVEEPDGRRVEI